MIDFSKLPDKATSGVVNFSNLPDKISPVDPMQVSHTTSGIGISSQESDSNGVIQNTLNKAGRIAGQVAQGVLHAPQTITHGIEALTGIKQAAPDLVPENVQSLGGAPHGLLESGARQVGESIPYMVGAGPAGIATRGALEAVPAIGEAVAKKSVTGLLSRSGVGAAEAAVGNIPGTLVQEQRLPTTSEEAGAGIFGGVAPIVGTGLKTVAEVFKRPSVEQSIEKGIIGGIKPSIASTGKTIPEQSAYLKKAQNAVGTIIDNKDNLNLTTPEGDIITGSLPKSVQQFSEAVNQTKKNIFQQYDSLAKQAGEQGAVVNTKKVGDELIKIADRPEWAVIEDQHPELSNYIIDKALRYEKRGQYTAEQAQQSVKEFNDALQSFYRNPSYESWGKARVDAMIANNIRKELDNSIENATGSQYQELKSKYGALSSIEKDVAHRSMLQAKRAPAGLLDFTDIFTAGDLMRGFATMNPATIAGATVQKGLKEYIKMINNPDKIVAKMFTEVEKPKTSQTISNTVSNIGSVLEGNRGGLDTAVSGSIKKKVPLLKNTK